MRSIVFLAVVLLAVAFTVVASDAAQEWQSRGQCVPTVCDWERWDKSVADECIIRTTTYYDVGIGDTVTIEIVSADRKLAPGDPVSVRDAPPTPGSSAAVISQARLDAKRVSVILESCSSDSETAHLIVSLDNGDKVGVTLNLSCS